MDTHITQYTDALVGWFYDMSTLLDYFMLKPV